jgi:glutamate synthase domain-containing protein 3
MTMKAASVAPPAGVMEGYRYAAPEATRDGDAVTLDAAGVYYQQLNDAVRDEIAGGAKRITLAGVNGQRYIGCGLRVSGVKLDVLGTAGNDMAMFNDGVEIEVFGNAQDGVGNTMSNGRIVVHGDAGDVLGYGMRGGRVYIKGDVGYRVGIHMKAYEKLVPVLVCGGKARDFFGEYMAGGMLVLLGMNTRDEAQPIAGSFLGAGMHGGVIYLRGTVESWQCGAEVGISEASEEDLAELRPVIEDYAAAMGMDADEILSQPFTRIVPMSHRPYAKLYAPM